MNNKQIDSMYYKQLELVIELQGLLDEAIRSEVRQKVKTKQIAEVSHSLQQAIDTLHTLKMIQAEDSFSDMTFITSTFEPKKSYEEFNTSVSKSLEKANEWDNIRFMSDEEYRQYKKENL